MRPTKRFGILLCLLIQVYAGSVLGGPAAAASFTVEPYLLDVIDRAATVAFELSESLEAEVRIGDGHNIDAFTSPASSEIHFIRVTGLSPGTVYRYEVVAGDGALRTTPNDPNYSIRTAGQPGEAFHFAVFGDPRPGESGTNRHHREVVQAVTALEPAFCLLLGDMVDDGREINQWRDFFAIEAPLLRHTPIYPVLGDNDHGGGKGLASRYFPKLRRGCYRFQWGEVQFLALNGWDTRGRQSSKELGPDSSQVQWLRQELSRPEVQQAAYRVVFVHDPVFISRGRSAEIIKRVWAPIFEANRVDVVFSSWHLYERSHKNGVTYIISGGAGAELIWLPPDPHYTAQVDARSHHYCVVDVTHGLMTIRAIATDGTVLDDFSLTPRSGNAQISPNAAKLADRIVKRVPLGLNTNPPLPLHLFSYDCAYCRRLLNKVLPSMAERFDVALDVRYYDLGIAESYDLFLTAGAAFGRQNADLPAIFIGSKVLGGESEIKAGLCAEIETYAAAPVAYQSKTIDPFNQSQAAAPLKRDTFDTLSLGLVAGAGLLDGLNPCAFTTIVFLVSYMALFGADRRRIYLTGTIFILAVFITYLAIGLAFFHTLKQVLMNGTVALAVNIVLLSVVLLLGVLSAVDFFRALNGRMSDVVLKLPAFIRNHIQARIAAFSRNPLMNLAMPFGLGVLVSGMELTCTGQVYVPIVTMLADPLYRLRALSYLLVYNIAFILPLVGVFALAVAGWLHGRMGQGKGYVAAVKFGHTVLFGVLAGVTLYNIGWI
jgi:cytochrome c biogenesis protein CcdA